MINNLILYGAGKRGLQLCEVLSQLSVKVAAVVDSDPNKWGQALGSYYITSPEIMCQFQDITLCITIADVGASAAIRKQLYEKYSIVNEVRYYELILVIYRNNPIIKNHILLPSVSVTNENKDTVLFDCFMGLGLGGVEAWTIDICTALLKAGSQNLYIISDTSEYDTPQELSRHVKRIDISHHPKFSLSSVINVIDIIMQMLPCKVVTCDTDEVMLAAYLIKCFYPNMIHIISVIHGGRETLYENYLGFAPCSDIYIGVSQDIKQAMIKRGVDPSKVYSMNCPFPCQKQLNRTYNETALVPIRIGCAGRLAVDKGMWALLKLIGLLNDWGACFQMDIAGDGALRKDMEDFVRSRHLEDKISFLGKLDRSCIPAFWQNCDVCVNISNAEGRSISIIEAMGNGAVPVVTATSGVSDDITDSINGYIVPVGDIELIAKRIIYLAEHRELLYQMGMLAHNAVYPKSLMEPHMKFWANILYGVNGQETSDAEVNGKWCI